ncbi:GTA-gp10 family protein [Mesorhizobium marinum]|uniref:GTA-gp10 family protein n=1 Tax=Mesorhizobium marinum TaxID=3228790 RepID=A0ABV3R5I3_9HYPH
MANPHKGQVDLKAGDKTYTLSFSINAMCELEAHFDEPITKIAARLQEPDSVSMTNIRALLWAALIDGLPEIKSGPNGGLDFAGQLLSEAGVPEAMDALGRAFASAFPSEASAKGNPRKAARAS